MLSYRHTAACCFSVEGLYGYCRGSGFDRAQLSVLDRDHSIIAARPFHYAACSILRQCRFKGQCFALLHCAACFAQRDL